ncbi:MAG: KpsF/GutQ family sugar-phosphate isomerase [Gammaproteobacteria bacterium]
MIEPERFCHLGLAVIETEAAAINQLSSRIDSNFSKACELMLHCEGRIVVLGMGKSGHIANKIAATLASTGTPAFFVHPGEASHGDMGMITSKDVVLALSNSGETSELLIILPLIKRLNTPLIALTGNPQSTLAQNATVNIDVSVDEEACPLGLAPTSSTTASLVMGDALAIALLEARGFTAEDFALAHPGGSLGKKLLLRIHDLMHTGDRIPHLTEDALLTQALVEMTQKGFGMTLISDANNKLIGIYTDGDLRRTLDADLDIHKTRIGEVMTRNCKTIQSNLLAAEALQMMQQYKITCLAIVDDTNTILGIIHLHDLLRAGVL